MAGKYKTVTEKDSSIERLQHYIREHMAEKDRQALMGLLKDPNGRWFLMRLLDKTKVMTDCFTGNSSTFYNEGRRKVGVDLVNEIAALGLEAFGYKQQAEREYILEQQRMKELFFDEASREDESKDE